MLETLMPLIVLLSWLALPVTLICIVDDWLLRPRRVIASGRQTVPDAPLMRALYGALPVLLACAVLRLLLAERLDFSAVLLAITVLTGLVWALDAALLRLRAVPHPFRFHDAHAPRRGFHHRQQVRLRAAPAGDQSQGPPGGRAAARRRGGIPLAGGPFDQLHQAPGRPAGRSRRSARQPHHDQRPAGGLHHREGPVQRRLLCESGAGRGASRQP